MHFVEVMSCPGGCAGGGGQPYGGENERRAQAHGPPLRSRRQGRGARLAREQERRRPLRGVPGQAARRSLAPAAAPHLHRPQRRDPARRGRRSRRRLRGSREQTRSLMDGVINTIKQNCRRCYTCVRDCPAKAIRIEDGQASVVADRCISCGNCTMVCSQDAKAYKSGIEGTLRAPRPRRGRGSPRAVVPGGLQRAARPDHRGAAQGGLHLRGRSRLRSRPGQPGLPRLPRRATRPASTSRAPVRRWSSTCASTIPS